MQKHIKRALSIKRTLGVRIAAGYLRNKGYDVDLALLILVYRGNYA